MKRNHHLTRTQQARTLAIALQPVEGIDEPHRLHRQFHFDRACHTRRIAR